MKRWEWFNKIRGTNGDINSHTFTIVANFEWGATKEISEIIEDKMFDMVYKWLSEEVEE